jgi:hypothetical protein
MINSKTMKWAESMAIVGQQKNACKAFVRTPEGSRTL